MQRRKQSVFVGGEPVAKEQRSRALLMWECLGEDWALSRLCSETEEKNRRNRAARPEHSQEAARAPSASPWQKMGWEVSTQV